MRTLNIKNHDIERLLDELLYAPDCISYRTAFYNIGLHIGSILNTKINELQPIALACASEDADWLAKGIMDKFKYPLDLCVYWSNRQNFGTDSNNSALEFADIEKSYEEIQKDSKILIITKSIISSSCVIKSQIMRLVSTNDFKKIYIVSPVMYKDAEENLRKEFPERVYNLFEFIYFALDEDMDKNGWVVPGIGGSVYERLGIDSRSYFPRILDDRIP